MINLNSITIDQFSSKIDVDVSTDVGNLFTKVLLWKSKDFKKSSKVIDLSQLLQKTNNIESFAISAQDIEMKNVTGLFFIEFFTDEVIVPEDCVKNSNVSLAVVANLLPYKECVLSKTLSLDIKGCGTGGCESVTLISTLLSTLQTTIKYGFYEEAVKIIESLDELCTDCDNCPDYKNTLLINEEGFGTVNNAIILI